MAWADAPPAPPPPPAKPAAASLVVNAEVVVLLGTTVQGPGSVPQGMPQLTKPPFSVFNTYRVLDKIKMPNGPFWRIDIGQRLQKELPQLQAKGFAVGIEY